MNDPALRFPHQPPTVNSKRVSKTFEQTSKGFYDRIKKVRMGYKTKCWIWIGKPNSVGYGKIAWGGRNGNRMYAHRFSWLKYRGNIPDDLWVLHKCDIRNCVNPSHLFLGTAQDNTDDMYEKKRNKHVRGEDSLKSKVSEIDVLNIRRSGASGKMKRTEISELFNLSLSATCSILYGDTWSHVGGPLVAKRARWEPVKLSSNDVSKIKLMSLRGISQCKIANHFGVNQSHVNRIINGKARLRVV